MKPQGEESKAVRFSQRGYRQLLRAYPKEHREEYGAAMAQLFRDQCRDAWRGSRWRGLAALWLRVLPDLARTATEEHLTAIKRRMIMTAARKVFVGVAVAIFLLMTIAATLVTLILPETYASRARITVRRDSHYIPNAGQSPAGREAVPDPYFIQTEFEVLQSEVILDQVIDQLDLNTKWAQKYHMAGKLKTAESRQLLRGRLEFQPVRNTELVTIVAYSETGNEAAEIANVVATAYQNYSREQMLKKKESDKQLPKSSSQSAARVANDQSSVEIIDRAMPGLRPVRPNVPLNIFLGAVAGIFTGVVIGGAAAFFVGKLSRRKEAV